MGEQWATSYGKLMEKLRDWFDAVVTNLPNFVVALVAFSIAYLLAVGTRRVVALGRRRAGLPLGRQLRPLGSQTHGGLVRAERPVHPVFLALARHRSTQRSRICAWWQETSWHPELTLTVSALRERYPGARPCANGPS